MAFLISSVHHHERSSVLRMGLNLKWIVCDYAELQQQIVLEVGYCQFAQRVERECYDLENDIKERECASEGVERIEINAES